jgi:hypothetical protein
MAFPENRNQYSWLHQLNLSKAVVNHVFAAFIQRMGYRNPFLSPINELYTALHANESMRISSTY